MEKPELNIWFSETNIVSGTNNSKLTYTLTHPIDFTGYEVCLKTISVFYSFPSIITGSAYSFSYVWVDGLTYGVTIPDNYTGDLSDYNLLMQNQMLANLHYYIDTAGATVFSAQIVANGPLYKCQINCYPVPISGVTYPSGNTWSAAYVTAATQKVPEITINANLGVILGFSAGTYPSVQPTPGSTYSIVSNSGYPSLVPYSAVLLNCSLVSTVNSSPSQSIVWSMPISVPYGTVISQTPTQWQFFSTQPFNTGTIDIWFTDQNNQPLVILDPVMSVGLYIRPIFNMRALMQEQGLVLKAINGHVSDTADAADASDAVVQQVPRLIADLKAALAAMGGPSAAGKRGGYKMRITPFHGPDIVVGRGNTDAAGAPLVTAASNRGPGQIGALGNVYNGHVGYSDDDDIGY